MNGWIKYYADGSSYMGTDYAVKTRLASWRNSENQNIVKTELNHGSLQIAIYGIGEFWQSDLYESVFPGPISRLKKRRLFKRIEETDSFYKVCLTENSLHIKFNCSSSSAEWIPITKSLQGKWIMVEIDTETQQTRHSLVNSKA